MARRTDLPSMPSCNGCGACCGPVTARPEEAKRIRRYVEERGIQWETNPVPEGTISFACGFLRQSGDDSYTCAIHEVRPWACRAFGVIKEMPCALFPEDAVVSFPRQKAQTLRLIDPDDKYLGEYFERSYLVRIGGRHTGVALHNFAASMIQRRLLQGVGRGKQTK